MKENSSKYQIISDYLNLLRKIIHLYTRSSLMQSEICSSITAIVFFFYCRWTSNARCAASRRPVSTSAHSPARVARWVLPSNFKLFSLFLEMSLSKLTRARIKKLLINKIVINTSFLSPFKFNDAHLAPQLSVLHKTVSFIKYHLI